MFPFVHHSTQLQLLLTCMLPAPGSRFLTREFNGLPCFAGKPAEASLARLASLPANSVFYPISRVNPRKPHLPDLFPYPRIQWSASFRGYASLLPATGTCFFTREFSGLPCFAGKPAEASLARLASLPAISAVCPVSRVYELKNALPNLLPYPRFQLSAPFRG